MAGYSMKVSSSYMVQIIKKATGWPLVSTLFELTIKTKKVTIGFGCDHITIHHLILGTSCKLHDVMCRLYTSSTGCSKSHRVQCGCLYCTDCLQRRLLNTRPSVTSAKSIPLLVLGKSLFFIVITFDDHNLTYSPEISCPSYLLHQNHHANYNLYFLYLFVHPNKEEGD